jgi:enoyl-CoA hydratase/carnithine racemase
MTVPERLETLEQLNGTIKKIKNCSKPTIAAVEGGAAGAGVSLAMACDFLIMSDKSFLSLAYVKIGLTPDGGVTKLLAEVLPKQILSEMALIGDRIFAKKLFDLGFLNLISDAGEVKTDALKFSEKFKKPRSNNFFAKIRSPISAISDKICFGKTSAKSFVTPPSGVSPIFT